MNPISVSHCPVESHLGITYSIRNIRLQMKMFPFSLDSQVELIQWTVSSSASNQIKFCICLWGLECKCQSQKLSSSWLIWKSLRWHCSFGNFSMGLLPCKIKIFSMIKICFHPLSFINLQSKTWISYHMNVSCRGSSLLMLEILVSEDIRVKQFCENREVLFVYLNLPCQRKQKSLK